MKHASLFSGIGGFDLAAEWIGWKNLFWCEKDEFCQQVLKYHFPKSIGYEDIKKADFTKWNGKVDVLTGGFPCQPFSVAGQRKGAEDDRYLWPEMLRAIREIQPAWVIGENVAGILSVVQPGSEITVESQASLFEKSDKETLLEQEYVVETVCRSIEQEGYSVQPIIIPACAIGAPHRRDRIWFIAHRTDTRAESVQQGRENRIHQFSLAPDACSQRCHVRGSYRTERPFHYHEERHTPKDQPKGDKWKHRTCKNGAVITNPHGKRRKKLYSMSERTEPGFDSRLLYAQRNNWQHFPTQPPICRRNDGIPFNVDELTISFSKWRTKSIEAFGNAIVPQVAYEIFKAIDFIENQETA